MHKNDAGGKSTQVCDMADYITQGDALSGYLWASQAEHDDICLINPGASYSTKWIFL